MFDAITRLFAQPEPSHFHNEPRLAVAALLVHLSAVDGQVTDGERAAVRNALMDHYGLAEDEVDRLLATATRRDSEAVDFYRFTSAITSLDEAERLEIVRMMWQVVFADGKNHELEDNMVWRIAELIGVSARDRTTLRKQMSRSKAAD
jgi:uncharacterized tellurite resistance protein B-like protein